MYKLRAVVASPKVPPTFDGGLTRQNHSVKNKSQRYVELCAITVPVSLGPLQRPSTHCTCKQRGRNGRMLDVRKTQPFPHYICFLWLIAFSVLATANNVALAQNKNDKDRAEDKDSKKSAVGGVSLIKVEGKVRCDKPDPDHSIEVPDRPGHALIITRRQCTWTEPMVIMGAKTKDGVAVSFSEKMEGTLHIHGFETDTLDNGEKLTWQSRGQWLAEKGPVDSSGRWSLMRGTGKFKGIKGGGSYEGKLLSLIHI